MSVTASSMHDGELPVCAMCIRKAQCQVIEVTNCEFCIVYSSVFTLVIRVVLASEQGPTFLLVILIFYAYFERFLLSYCRLLISTSAFDCMERLGMTIEVSSVDTLCPIKMIPLNILY